ncbi:MAG TPA: VOC family protein [Acidimicrobiia bacterium]|nr:VOC family protein [Acidimicrobiia bacterium]
MSGTRVHHSAICARDIDESVRFYRDGIGLTVMMDGEFEGDWPTLFAARGTKLRSVFLGDPELADAGILELVAFVDGMADAPTAPAEPAPGFLLVSLYVDVDPTLQRLAALGLGGEPRRISLPGPAGAVTIATVRDPDGVLVELIDTSAS